MQRQFSRPISVPLQIVLCILIGILMGASTLWLPPVFVAMGVAGILYLVISWVWPEIAVLAILLLTSTIFDINEIPSVPIGFGHFVVTDFLIFIPIGIILVRSRVEPGFVLNHTPLDLPLLAFYSIAILSTIIAILHSSLTFNQSLGEIRNISSYLIFFIVVNLIRNKQQLQRLLKGLFFLATLVAMFMIIQYFMGHSIKILPGRVEELITAGNADPGVTRILPPGQSLVLVVLICLIVLLIFDRKPTAFIFRFIQASIIGLALLFTFARNFWVALLLAIIFVWYLISEQDKVRTAKIAIWSLFVVGIVCVPIAISMGSKAYNLINSSATRFMTIFSPNTLNEESLQYRYIENSYAFSQIASHPLIGSGLGSVYRSCDRRIDSSCDSISVWNFLTFIHNSYLWIMLKTGLLGYFCFMILLFFHIKRGLRNWPKIPHPFFKATALSLTVVIVAIIPSALIVPVFNVFHWTPLIALIFGINEVIYKIFEMNIQLKV